jgi:hypothetical protein
VDTILNYHILIQWRRPKSGCLFGCLYCNCFFFFCVDSKKYELSTRAECSSALYSLLQRNKNLIIREASYFFFKLTAMGKGRCSSVSWIGLEGSTAFFYFYWWQWVKNIALPPLNTIRGYPEYLHPHNLSRIFTADTGVPSSYIRQTWRDLEHSGCIYKGYRVKIEPLPNINHRY